MRRRLRFAAALVAILAAPQASFGQEILSVERPPPPYEDQLLRLSEILGAIHYLRHLCAYDEKEVWREQMAAILDAEEPEEPRARASSTASTADTRASAPSTAPAHRQRPPRPTATSRKAPGLPPTSPPATAPPAKG